MKAVILDYYYGRVICVELPDFPSTDDAMKFIESRDWYTADMCCWVSEEDTIDIEHWTLLADGRVEDGHAICTI